MTLPELLKDVVFGILYWWLIRKVFEYRDLVKGHEVQIEVLRERIEKLENH